MRIPTIGPQLVTRGQADIVKVIGVSFQLRFERL